MTDPRDLERSLRQARDVFAPSADQRQRVRMGLAARPDFHAPDPAPRDGAGLRDTSAQRDRETSRHAAARSDAAQRDAVARENTSAPLSGAAARGIYAPGRKLALLKGSVLVGAGFVLGYWFAETRGMDGSSAAESANTTNVIASAARPVDGAASGPGTSGAFAIPPTATAADGRLAPPGSIDQGPNGRGGLDASKQGAPSGSRVVSGFPAGESPGASESRLPSESPALEPVTPPPEGTGHAGRSAATSGSPSTSAPGPGAPAASGSAAASARGAAGQSRSGAPRALRRAHVERAAAHASREELALMQRAERAVRSGDGALARSFIEELESRFPKTTWREERDAILVLAACALDEAHARENARAFLRRRTASVYLDRIATLCRLAGVPSQAAPAPNGSRNDGH